MHLRFIRAILVKDLRDALKDGRVLAAIIVPLAIGIFYGVIFNNSTPQPSATVAYSAASSTTLPHALSSAAGTQVELTLKQVDAAQQVRQLVDQKNADIGLVIPAGFDQQVRSGNAPPLTIIRRETSTFGENYVSATLDSVLRAMAGQRPPATIQTTVIPTATTGSQAIFDQLGLRRYFVLAAAVMLIGMIALMAVPVILAEESEKKTLDALVMIASYLDVVVAKALVGVVYIAVALALLLGLTRLSIANIPLFVGGTLLLTLALIGFGLMLAGIFKSATQLNTWVGFLVFPVVVPAFVVGVGGPRALQIVLDLLPTSQAMKLMINGLDNHRYFTDLWLSFLVLAVWAIAAYALLLWTLQRREG